MWKRSPQRYGTTPIPETPYQKAAQVWDRHTWQFIKGAALSSLLSIGAELASDDGDRLTRALQNGGQDSANIAGQRIIDRSLNIQPTLKVRPGWRFNVIVSRDLILKPYGDQ